MEMSSRSKAQQSTQRVKRRMSLDLVDATGSAVELVAEFGYRADDPYAVSITFFTEGPDVTWSFARDLLVAGLTSPHGAGDVHVWPSVDGAQRSVVVIELASPGGEAVLQARAGDVEAFLDASLALVPAGTESDHLDLEGLVAALLAA